MIRVDVQPYCDSCMSFEPDVEEPMRHYHNLELVAQSDTVIHCKYRKRCENMVRYLQKQIDQAKDKGEKS